MNPELAEDLLRAVMVDAADAEYPRQLGILRALATYKYDDYQQYAPGRQFIASLAGWLNQFEAGLERKNALRFVQERLIYISDIEMRHLVNLMARGLGSSDFAARGGDSSQYPFLSPHSSTCQSGIRACHKNPLFFWA